MSIFSNDLEKSDAKLYLKTSRYFFAKLKLKIE
jgi:hypothetical protein